MDMMEYICIEHIVFIYLCHGDVRLFSTNAIERSVGINGLSFI